FQRLLHPHVARTSRLLRRDNAEAVKQPGRGTRMTYRPFGAVEQRSDSSTVPTPEPEALPRVHGCSSEVAQGMERLFAPLSSLGLSAFLFASNHRRYSLAIQRGCRLGEAIGDIQNVQQLTTEQRLGKLLLKELTVVLVGAAQGFARNVQ